MLEDQLEWTEKVKAVLARAKPARPPAAELQSRRAFRLYEFNTGPVLGVEQTPRARAIREVGRIASWYQGLQGEVPRALDAAGACSLTQLSDDALDQLLARMRLLEDNIQNGGEAPDAPAAR